MMWKVKFILAWFWWCKFFRQGLEKEGDNLDGKVSEPSSEDGREIVKVRQRESILHFECYI